MSIFFSLVLGRSVFTIIVKPFEWRWGYEHQDRAGEGRSAIVYCGPVSIGTSELYEP